MFPLERTQAVLFYPNLININFFSTNSSYYAVIEGSINQNIEIVYMKHKKLEKTKQVSHLQNVYIKKMHLLKYISKENVVRRFLHFRKLT